MKKTTETAKISAREFVERAVWIANDVKTTYVQGGQGEPLTPDKIEYFISNPNYPWNKAHADEIRKATPDTFAFDCIGFPRADVNGFKGDPTQPYGGSVHGSPFPDTAEGSIEATVKKHSTSVSTDFTNVELGEFLSYADYSHCGIYVGVINGQRMAAESTHNTSYNGKSGVQLICIDRAERKNMWKYHTKLELVDYSGVTPSPVVDTTTLKGMVTVKVKAKKGDKSEYVKEIQKVLIARGYSCGKTGADGDFGNNTEKAVKAFQTDRNLTADGIVGYDTITRLIGV